MAFVLKFKLGMWRIDFRVLATTEVLGMYSLLKDGKSHILMWDFDNVTFQQVISELAKVQQEYKLPNIYILSSKTNHYNAWCFKRVSFELAREIIAKCHSVDSKFYAMGCYRGKWTLRISPKCGRKFKVITVLESDVPEDVSFKDLAEAVIYETVMDGCKYKIYEIGKLIRR